MRKENSSKKTPFPDSDFGLRGNTEKGTLLDFFHHKNPFPHLSCPYRHEKKIPQIWYHLDRFIGTILRFLLYLYVKPVQFCVRVGQWFNLRGNTKKGTLLDIFHHKNLFPHLSYPYRQDHKNPRNLISLGPLLRPGPLGDPTDLHWSKKRHVTDRGIQLTF